MKREIKIGLFAVVMIIVAWAGIRFLKGFDIFSRNTVYYAAYDQINGVQSASPVMMKGVKVGSVTGLYLDPVHTNKVVVQLTIKRHFQIPDDSEAKIFSSSIMGAKAIEIIYGTSPTYLEKNDTLHSSHDRDLLDAAGSELEFIKQKIAQITDDLSRTMANINSIMETNAVNIEGTIYNLNTLSGDMALVVRRERENISAIVDNFTRFSSMLGDNSQRVDSIISGLNNVIAQLSEQELGRNLTEAVKNVNSILSSIESGEGSIGKLMTDPALYDSLTLATGNLAAVLADLKAYPGRYVHFSLFGRDPEKMKERDDKRKAKAAAKAEKDSLKHLK